MENVGCVYEKISRGWKISMAPVRTRNFPVLRTAYDI